MKIVRQKTNTTFLKFQTIFLKTGKTFTTVAISPTSVRFSVTKIGFILIPLCNGIVCGLTITNKALKEIFVNKNKKYKKYDGAQQTNNFFDKMNRNCLQGVRIDKEEYDFLCILCTKNLKET